MNDNSTTESAEATLPEVVKALRGVPNAVSTEHSTFSFEWKCDLIFTVKDNALTITLEIGEGEGKASTVTKPRPLQYFGTPNNLNAFLVDLKRNYFATLRDTLQHEAVLHLHDVLTALRFMMGLEAGGAAEIIKQHTKDAEVRLRKMLEQLPDHHRGGAWTKIALKTAVQTATLRLLQRGVKGRDLNLDAVNKDLRAAYGSDAPQSGEALRKQLDERGLSWRQLKTEVQRFEANATSGENGDGHCQ
jgi:hypothetical protein